MKEVQQDYVAVAGSQNNGILSITFTRNLVTLVCPRLVEFCCEPVCMLAGRPVVG